MTVTDACDEVETQPCAACQAQIDPEASECPECGNYPAKTAKRASLMIMVAGTLLLVIPPVGILVLLVGLTARVGMVLVDYPAVEYDF